MHAHRYRRAVKRGRTPVVIPYTGYGTPAWTRVLGRVVLAKPVPAGRTGADARYRKIRGWRSFMSISVGGAATTVTINGEPFTVTTDRGGVIDTTLPTSFTPGWHTITLTVNGSEPSTAHVFIVDPSARIGIVSDIDDTVMVTALPRPLLAAWNTFVLDEHARTPVPGMSVLLDRLSREHEGAPVIYLSTGAWNVAPTLERFLTRHLYPPGPLLLTDWGPTHDRWFRNGREHKEANLDRLADDFPHLKWLLLGDDGQHDEKIYAEFAARHPGRVAAIGIRQLTGGEAVLAGGRKSTDDHAELPEAWAFAPNGAGLAEQFAELGLLRRLGRRRER
ncbi:MAG TPA: DUF2183 domain-containing protein [Terrimesophilobacter sp.]|nr:DUF2183 domain-containing protein [Terrimesophilobacter sp.]HRP99091.1 DUF2183 domain-containing protein [Terrimesophilobacter sp.]